MRDLDERTAAILAGSRGGDHLTVSVWYDGRLAHPDPLPVGSWSVKWDDTRQVKGVLALDVHDKTGRLSPWLPDDVLGVGGSRLQVAYQVGGGGGEVSLGWFRIVKTAPQDLWQLRLVPDLGHRNVDSEVPDDMRLVSVAMGSTIPVDAEDMAVVIKNDRLLAPESPRGFSPTVVGEVTRLLGDIVPVTVLAGVEDMPVPRSVIYERERLDAVEDLLARIDAGWRMNGNGEFEVYPLSDTAIKWELRGGEGGMLIQVDREQTLDGLENYFVSDGTRKALNSKGEEVDLPVRGISAVGSGPLRVDGPHGRFPAFRSSPLITSQNMADADARTFRSNHVASRTIDLQVSCLPQPALELGDYVTVAHPVVDGRRVQLAGRVLSMELSGSEAAVNEMRLTVTCGADLVMEVMRGVQRG